MRRRACAQVRMRDRCWRAIREMTWIVEIYRCWSVDTGSLGTDAQIRRRSGKNAHPQVDGFELHPSGSTRPQVDDPPHETEQASLPVTLMHIGRCRRATGQFVPLRFRHERLVLV